MNSYIVSTLSQLMEAYMHTYTHTYIHTYIYMQNSPGCD